MTQDRRQRGKVDSSLRQARCECVSQVIEHEIKNNSVFLRLLQYSVMSAIQAADISTRIAPRWEYPGRLPGHPAPKDDPALRGEVQGSTCCR